MKYIKNFENTEQFNEGDYILIKPDYFKDKIKRPAKIIKIEEVIKSGEVFRGCFVDLVDWKNFWIHFNMIDRKLTQQEIEKFELDCDSKKFNV